MIGCSVFRAGYIQKFVLEAIRFVKMRRGIRIIRHVRSVSRHHQCNNYSTGLIKRQKLLVDNPCSSGSKCSSNSVDVDKFLATNFFASRGLSTNADKVTTAGCVEFWVVF